MNEVFNFLGLREHDIEDTGIKNKRKYSSVTTNTNTSVASNLSDDNDATNTATNKMKDEVMY